MDPELIPTLVGLAIIAVGFAIAIITAPNDLGGKKKRSGVVTPEDISVVRGSGKFFADLCLPDADTHQIMPNP